MRRVRIIANELAIMFKRAAGEPTHFSNAKMALNSDHKSISPVVERPQVVCMCVYIYIYASVYILIYIYKYIYIYMFLYHKYLQVYIHIHVFKYI